MRKKLRFNQILKRCTALFLALFMVLSLIPTTPVQASIDLYNEAVLKVLKTSKEYDLTPAGVNKKGIIYEMQLDGSEGFCLDAGKHASSGKRYARTGIADKTYQNLISYALYDDVSAFHIGAKPGIWSESNYALAQALVWGYAEGRSSYETAILIDIIVSDVSEHWRKGKENNPDFLKMVSETWVKSALTFERQSIGTVYVYDSGIGGNQRLLSTTQGVKPSLKYNTVSSEKSYTATDSVALTIHKTDKQTSNPLSNISFDLYKDNVKVTTVTTDTNGNAFYTFQEESTKTVTSTKEYCSNYHELSIPNQNYVNIDYISKEHAQAAADAEAISKAKTEAEKLYSVRHTYKVVETKTKEAYYLNPSTTTQSTSYASGDGSGTVTFHFTNTRQTGSIEITKTDKETEYLLDGAVYGLYAREDIMHPDGITGVVYTKDSYVGTFPATGVNGKAVFNNLYLGKYYVKEITAPSGYVHNTETYDVELIYAGQNVSVTDASATVTDKVQRGSVEVSKLDKELSNGKNAAIYDSNKDGAQGDASIVGATYGLYAKEDILHPDGTTGVVTYNDVAGSIHELKAIKGTDLAVKNRKATKGALLATIKTDKNGEFGFENLYNGKYYIKEIEESEGYLVDKSTYDIDLSYTNQNESVVLKSTSVYETVKKQAFDLVKVGHASGASQAAKPLEGVEFTVKLESDVIRLGWENAPTYDVLTTDAKGKAYSIELPYGVYRVRETKAAENYNTANDFFVTVEEDNRTHQSFTNSIIIDEEYQALLKILKLDKESGKPVKIAGAEFKLKALTDVIVDGKKFDAGEYIGYWNWNIFDGFYTDTWKTNEDGYVLLNEKLGTGTYQIEEIRAPYGYVLDKELVTFKVSNSDMYNISQDGKTQILVVEKSDISVKGQISVEKRGEVLVDFKDGKFIYEERALAGAKYDIIAKQDIMDPSNDGTVLFAKDTVVETLTTNATGKAISSKLPLGKYYVKETTAPHGMVINENAKNAELAYKDQVTEVVFDNASFINDRQKVDINVIKKDADTDKFVTGAEITLYAKQDIKAADGTILFKADDIIRTIQTNDKGTADFGTDLPLSTYYIKETKAPLGYASKDVTYELDASYAGQNKKVIELTSTFVNEPTVVEISKQDITTGVEVAGNKLYVVDANGNTVDAWTSVQGEKHVIKYLHVGETYTLVEELAAEGYVKATSIEFTIKDIGEIQAVTMKDERVVGTISVEKRGEVLVDFKDGEFIYEVKGIAGAKIEIYAAEDIKHPDGVTKDFYKKGDLVTTLVTDKNGQASISELPLGKYIGKEVTAPNGTVINTKEFDIALVYAGQHTKVVFDDFEVINERQKVKLDLNKLDLDENVPLYGAEFTIYANKDIVNYLGEVIVKKGEAVAIAVSDEEGNINFNIDLPIDLYSNVKPLDEEILDNGFNVTTDVNGNIVLGDVNAMFYMKETKHPIGYASLTAVMYLDTSYQGQDVKDFTISYDLYNEITRVAISKKDIVTGEPVVGAQLSIVPVDENGEPKLGETFTTWITIADDPATKEDESIYLVKGLEPGNYMLVELSAPLGYKVADSIRFEVTDTSALHIVEMKDAPVLTDIQVNKVDSVTKEAILSKDFVFGLYADKECTLLIAEEYADKETGTATFKDLRYGTYYIKELEAPKGYKLSDEVKEIIINDELEGVGGIHTFVYENTLIPVSIVQTGDSTSVLPFLGLGILGLFAIVFAINKKKLVFFTNLLVILLLFTACSSAELEDSFINDKELHSKADEIDTAQDNEMSIQTTDSEKDAITTESKDVKVEHEEAVSEKTNTSKPEENVNNKPATNPTPSTPTTSIPTTSKPTTNSSSNTGSGFEDEELTDDAWEDVPLEPQTSREAFDLINAERLKLGIEPAVWDAECERIALIRGDEIAPYAIPEHDGFLKFQNENRKLCECLAWGYLTAEGVVDGWMNSLAHKNILMDPDYVKLAVVRIGNKWVAVNSR